MRRCSRVVWMVGWGLGCWSPASWAQDLEAVVAGMRACAAEQDGARRLACYDSQFRSMAAPPASASATLSPEQRFGLNPRLERTPQGADSQPPELAKLTSRIAAVSYKLRGQAVVTLENGQVWEQADTDTRADLQARDSITIRRGTLGSFWLSSPKSGFRVRRVK